MMLLSLEGVVSKVTARFAIKHGFRPRWRLSAFANLSFSGDVVLGDLGLAIIGVGAKRPRPLKAGAS